MKCCKALRTYYDVVLYKFIIIIIIIIISLPTRPLMVCRLVIESRTRSPALRDSMSFSECVPILTTQQFVSCLTFCTKDFSDKIKRGWNGKMIHSCSLSNHSKGVCILLAKDLPCKVISTHHDDDGRIILINIELNNVEYAICNIYCPNNVSDSVTFLRYVNDFVKSHAVSRNRTLIGGDFIPLSHYSKNVVRTYYAHEMLKFVVKSAGNFSFS